MRGTPGAYSRLHAPPVRASEGGKAISGYTCSRLRLVAPQPALPASVDLTAYRVVQEALTNVIKHADQAPTAVRIEYRAHDLLIDVANEAPAGPGTGLGGGNGRGLIGLRERIAIYRGFGVDARSS